MKANPALRRLKQEDCYETGIALSCRVSFEPYWTTEGVFLNHSKGRRMEIKWKQNDHMNHRNH